MTPFRAIYLKEFREHRISLALMFAVLFLMNLIQFCMTGIPDPFWMGSGFYLFGFYITAIAAMSYAKEDEAKTSQFLRRLPIRSSTIFRAKLSWLLTSFVVLSIPLLFWGRFYLKFRVSDGVFEFFFTGIPIFICLLIWSWFWTTRWPNKVYAVLMTFVSTYIFLLIVALIVLTTASFFYGGRLPQAFDPRFGFLFLISPLPVAWFSFRGVLTCYDRPEPEKKASVVISMPGQNLEKPKRRFLTRLFPSKSWTPFQGLLWQSFCQTRDVFLLCLVPGLLTFLWFYFFPGFWGNENMPIRTWAVNMPLVMQKFIELAGILTTMASILILFGVVSTIFSQDRESDRLRYLGYRGVSLWKFWWSRIIPYLFIILLIWLCTIIVISKEITEPIPMKNLCLGLGILLTLTLVPLCFGAFFSILFRGISVNIILTAVCSCLFYFSMFFFWPMYFLMPLALLGLLGASYSLAGSRLYDRPPSKSWQLPTLAVSLAVVLCSIPPLAYFLNKYL